MLVKRFPSCYICVLTHTTHIDIHLHNFNTFFLKSLSVLVFQERCSKLKIVLVILGACGFRLISYKNKKVCDASVSSAVHRILTYITSYYLSIEINGSVESISEAMKQGRCVVSQVKSSQSFSSSSKHISYIVFIQVC